ncbi:MAG: aspartate dehydrogenase [Nitrosopumilus sp. B06]|nr:MAG: aspartate dehydrogenase [Nitrosopumilus sp. B06]
MKKIGLLGCGAIGTQIALAIDSGEIPARLTHIFDTSEDAAITLASKLKTRPEIVKNSHLLSSHPVDMIVEAASQDAVRDVALGILQNRRDLMIMSTGALLDDAILDILSDACCDYNRTIYLPTGAIAGLDAIKAVRDELDSVSITTTKHPRSLRGAKFFETSDVDLDLIDAPTILFEGTAAEAVSLFPANINVAALLSLAGMNSRNTQVRIVADPGTSVNTHCISAAGKFGKINITVENIPDPANPKTSRLAVLSAIETLRGYCSKGVRLGT